MKLPDFQNNQVYTSILTDRSEKFFQYHRLQTSLKQRKRQQKTM